MYWFIPLCVLIIGYFIWKFYSSGSDSKLAEYNDLYLKRSKEVNEEIKKLAEENKETEVDIHLAFSHNPSIGEHCLIFRNARKIMLKGKEYGFGDILGYNVSSQDEATQKMSKSDSKETERNPFFGNLGEAIKELSGKAESAPQGISALEKTNIVDVQVNRKDNLVRLFVYPSQIPVLCTALDEIIAGNRSGENAVEGAKKDPLQKEGQTGLSIADELIKLKKLKEEGILTADEFDAQKSRLLNQ